MGKEIKGNEYSPLQLYDGLQSKIDVISEDGITVMNNFNDRCSVKTVPGRILW